jgi:hypothetical protein
MLNAYQGFNAMDAERSIAPKTACNATAVLQIKSNNEMIGLDVCISILQALICLDEHPL